MDLSRGTFSRRRILLSGASAAGASAFVHTISRAQAKAPLLGPARSSYFRFAMGDFEITTILDANATIDGPWPIVGEDRPKTDVAALMRDNSLPEARFRPGFTPTVVNTGQQLILFDAGNGERGFIPRPAGGLLAANLAAAGLKPEQIDLVVLSHAHIDHIGGLIEGGRPVFVNARYMIGEQEQSFWASEDRLLAATDSLEHTTATAYRTNLQPLLTKTTVIKPGGDVAPGIRAIAAYGHTPGHLAFHVESNSKRLLIWGDCAHHHVASLAKPEWHALFDMDKAQGAATRKRIYDMAATDHLPVLGYHMPFPSVGFVERSGGGYRWFPDSDRFG